LLAEFQKKEVMRMVMLKGSGFSDLRSHFLIMSLFAVLYNLLAVRSYKKTSA
jgi:ABC-2 type transport system permease protein